MVVAVAPGGRIETTGEFNNRLSAAVNDPAPAQRLGAMLACLRRHGLTFSEAWGPSLAYALADVADRCERKRWVD